MITHTDNEILKAVSPYHHLSAMPSPNQLVASQKNSDSRENPTQFIKIQTVSKCK